MLLFVFRSFHNAFISVCILFLFIQKPKTLFLRSLSSAFLWDLCRFSLFRYSPFFERIETEDNTSF